MKALDGKKNACTGKLHAGGSAYASLSVRLDHLFFTVLLFAMLCSSSAVFSYVQISNKLFMSACAYFIEE